MAGVAARAALGRAARSPWHGDDDRDAPASSGGTRTGSRRRTDAAGARASSTRRCPSAAPSARLRTGRRPSSRTSIQQLVAVAPRARCRCGRGRTSCATPCLIAFSTSGCSSRVGTSASSVSGWTSKRTTRRSAKRVCSISRYFARKSSSALSVHLLLAEVLERHAEQIAQPHQRPVGGLDVAVHQRRDRVQRVEQEVRVQLLLQRLELRLDQPGLELRRAQRAIARLAVVEDGVTEADDGPVGHHLPVEVQKRRPLRPPATRRSRPESRRQPPLHARHRRRCARTRTRRPTARGRGWRATGPAARTGSAARAR